MNDLATPSILAFAGRKQSGKDTCALFVLGTYMSKLGIIEGGFCVNENGLNITDIFGDKRFGGIFDPRRDNDTVRGFLEEYVHPYIKFYSFADKLKEFCVDVLGVEKHKIYGTNQQKNELTHLKWEDMPGVVYIETYDNQGAIAANELFYHKSGCMTGREVMQYFGTNIVRKIYGPAWAKETLRRIKKENTLLAVITDCRFEDEIVEVQAYGGKVVKLTRNVFKDEHLSETQLDMIPNDKFDAIIDNHSINIDEQNDILLKVLSEWGFVPETQVLG